MEELLEQAEDILPLILMVVDEKHSLEEWSNGELEQKALPRHESHEDTYWSVEVKEETSPAVEEEECCNNLQNQAHLQQQILWLHVKEE